MGHLFIFPGKTHSDLVTIGDVSNLYFDSSWKQIGNKTRGFELYFPTDFIKNFQQNGFNVNKHSL